MNTVKKEIKSLKGNQHTSTQSFHSARTSAGRRSEVRRHGCNTSAALVEEGHSLEEDENRRENKRVGLVRRAAEEGLLGFVDAQQNNYQLDLFSKPKRHRQAGLGTNRAYMQKQREGNTCVCTSNQEKDTARLLHLQRVARPTPNTQTRNKTYSENDKRAMSLIGPMCSVQG
jgi:hypothetical protein